MLHDPAKNVEQILRALQRIKDRIELIKDSFDSEMNFSWTEITAHQYEKSIFATYYVWSSAIEIQLLRDQLSTEVQTNPSLDTYLCGGFMEVSDDACNYHYRSLFSVLGDELSCISSKNADRTPHVAVCLCTEMHRIESL